MEINDAKDEKKDDEEKNQVDDIENETKTETEAKRHIEHDNESKEDKDEDEERRDFSAKESFSNPKSRKYFGKDQIFTGLDRRRSKFEDILLMDPVVNISHTTPHTSNANIATSTRTKLGTKRRNSYAFSLLYVYVYIEFGFLPYFIKLSARII